MEGAKIFSATPPADAVLPSRRLLPERLDRREASRTPEPIACTHYPIDATLLVVNQRPYCTRRCVCACVLGDEPLPLSTFDPVGDGIRVC